jgi:hypothetical protein
MKTYHLVILHGSGMTTGRGRGVALAGILGLAEQKAKASQDQANAFRELSSSLTLDTA